MANAIGTGVNVPDFRHITHHSLFQMKLESNILYVNKNFDIKNKREFTYFLSNSGHRSSFVHLKL